MKVLAAITTPFGPGGGLDLDAFEAHVRWLGEIGLDGLFVAGTTGEGALEDDEVEAWPRARWRPPAAAGDRPGGEAEHPGHGGAGAACARRGRGRRGGLRAVVLSGHAGDQVRAHFLALLEAAASAPAFIYNIPPRTVNDLSPELAGELARGSRG